MSSPKSERFLQLLAASRLLDDRIVAKTRALASSGKDPEEIAEKLVRRGHLTEWQARQLLEGRNGFFLASYKILKPLGKGGMGSVYKAFQPAMNRTVALKVMSRRTLKDERAIVRFQREIRAAAALDHPHIVHAFDADYVDNAYFLAMEYLGGRDLKYWIRAAGRLSIDWSCACIMQVALGLQYAHERGIVHRDIKPSNLLLVRKSATEWPHVKIADFGLARASLDAVAEAGLTRIGQGLGTSEYIAPEQARDSTTADIRADIYSLGCTMFELLSGQLPFEGNSPVEQLMARFTQSAPPISSLRPDVPFELDQIVARMMDRDPNRRFQTPADVAQALLPFSRLGRPAPSAVEDPSAALSSKMPANPMTDTDSSLDQFLESVSGHLSSRSFPGLPQAGQGRLLRAVPVFVFSAFVVVVLMVIISWSLAPRI